LKQDVIQAQQELVGNLPDSQAAHSPPQERNESGTGFLHHDEAIEGEAEAAQSALMYSVHLSWKRK
jgi:hypothetical protein